MAAGLTLTCAVRCSGTTHLIEWDGAGPVRWAEHDGAEEVLAALLGDEPPCAQVAKAVERSRRTPRALQLLAAAERLREAGTSKPDGRLAIVRPAAGSLGLWAPQLHQRLSDQAVLHALPTRWLAVLVGEAAVAAAASERAWGRLAPDDRADLVRATAQLAATAGGLDPASIVVARGQAPGVDADGTVRLTPAWLGRVWARGAASIGGHLVLDLQPTEPTEPTEPAADRGGEAGEAPADAVALVATPPGEAPDGTASLAVAGGVGGTWAAAGYAVG